MAFNPIDTIYGYVQSLTNKRDSNALARVMESVYPRAKVVNFTAITVAINELAHGLSRILTLNRAGGMTITLPPSTGLGQAYRFQVGTTFTGSCIIKVANASDFMFGNAYQAGAAGAATSFSTSNTGTAGTESDTITLNGTTTGGLKGDYIEIEDYALNAWRVIIRGRITGAAATPFSATV